MSQTLMKKHGYEMLKCVYCGKCCSVCPTFNQIGWESSSPRGKMKLIHGWAEGKIPLTDHLINQLYLCAGCEHCTVECPSGIPIVEIIKDARKELVKTKRGPIEPLRIVNSNIQNECNFLGKPKEERMDWTIFEDVIIEQVDKTEFLYLIGCQPSYWCSEIAASTVKVLKESKFEFGILGGEEWCCGLPALWSGDIGVFKEVAEHNIKAIKKNEAKYVFTTCPGCYLTTARDYPRILGKELGFQVFHITKIFYDLLKEGKLKFTKELKVKVTYHDPCHIGRTFRKFEQPREILKAIPGITLVEMKNNRLDSNCCGGLLASVSEELCVSLGKKRIKEALDVGAELIVTMCPQCYVNLRRSAIEAEVDIRVIDLPMLMVEAMNV
ncbi:(Fe-S)-binding protein [Candidatus Bathyarchaeota archaeon]|nr:(Fe-S)-binding protein [Candidatus Bathyarchaeota archaeon]